MAATTSDLSSVLGGGSLGGIANLLTTLTNLLGGSGKQTATDTTTAPGSATSGTSTNSGGTTTSSSTSSSSTNPDVISNLLQTILTAQGNSSDPSKTNDLVNNIVQNATLAFAPTAGQANASGLYQTTAIPQLAALAAGKASSDSAQAVLNYQSGQQQIAQNGLNTLGNLLKTTTNTNTTTTPQTSVTNNTVNTPTTAGTAARTSQTAPAIGNSSTNGIAAGGLAAALLGKSLLSGTSFSDIKGLLGFGGNSDASITPPIPMDSGSIPAAATYSPDELNNFANQGINGIVGPDTTVDATGALSNLLPTSSAAGITDFGGSGAADITSSTSEPLFGSGNDLTDLVGNLGGDAASSAVSDAGDSSFDIGDDVGDLFSSGWSAISNLFNF